MRKSKDISGLIFNDCKVIEFAYVVKHSSTYNYMWKCKCHCGKYFICRRDHIVEKRVKSCGCIRTNSYDSFKNWIKEQLSPDKCIEWDGYIEKKTGYGRIRCEGKRWSTHRLSYHLLKENIKDKEFVIMHTCDNRKCVNPFHLVKGTHSDNMEDMKKKGRQMSHENHHKSKLTQKKVKCIRMAHADLMNELSIKYSVSKSSLRAIIAKKTWKEEL